MVNGIVRLLVDGIALAGVIGSVAALVPDSRPPATAACSPCRMTAIWRSKMRAAPCTPFAAMVLTAIMTGTAAAGPTLSSASERTPVFERGHAPSSQHYQKYYEEAVRGDPDAQAKLAALYAEGAGVPRSDAYAFQWSIRAAGQGHPQAQLMLSEIFAAGKVPPKNSIAAYKWASIAEAGAREPQTREKAARMLDLFAPEMSEEQIDEARSLAADWKPKPELRQPGNGSGNGHAAENRVSRSAAPAMAPAKSSARLYQRFREARAAAEPSDRVVTQLKALRSQLRARLSCRICR